MDKDYLEKLVSKSNYLIGDKVHMIDKNAYVLHNNELKKYNITFNQSLVILHVYHSTNTYIYQKDIEKALGLTNPSVTSLIKTMMKKDLIYRIKDENDGRYYHLHLTPRSIELVDPVMACIKKVDAMITKALTDEERETFNKLLDKMLTTIIIE